MLCVKEFVSLTSVLVPATIVLPEQTNNINPFNRDTIFNSQAAKAKLYTVEALNN